jgi:hypothetical protein
MSVSGITNTLIQQSAMPSPAQQWRNDFNDLAKALDNGDMNSAQKAVASLQQLQSGLSKTTLQAITGADAGGEAQSTLANDLEALGLALKSGSLANSQTAFEQLQSNLHTNEQNTNQNGISAYTDSAYAGGVAGWAQRSSTNSTIAEATNGNSTFSILG